jgi:hypothetical protein
MKKLVLLLIVAMAIPASAGFVIQATQDTTPTLDYAHPTFGGVIGTVSTGRVWNPTPSGYDGYGISLSQSGVARGHFTIDTIIPDGVYTEVALTYETQMVGSNGLSYVSALWATTDAIANGRVSFTGGDGSWLTANPGWDDTTYGTAPLWPTENIIGTSNLITGVTPTRFYESVTISGYQAGDLEFYLWDQFQHSYSWVVWDTLEFIPEPMTISLLGLGALAFIRKRK